MSQESTKKDREQTQEGESGYIVSKAGTPFKSIQAAGLVMSSKKLDPDTHEVVQFNGGFAIAHRTDIKDNSTPQSVGSGIKPEVVAQVQRRVETPAENEDDASRPAFKPAPEEEVWWGSFAPKAKESDTEDVVLSVNGDAVQMMREQEVPLPMRFWEVAKNGTHAQYKQLPGFSRKIVARIRTYNYTLTRKGTWDDFYKWKAEGTQKQRESIERDQKQAEMANAQFQTQAGM